MLWLGIRRFLIFSTTNLWNSFLITEIKEPKIPNPLNETQNVCEDVTQDGQVQWEVFLSVGGGLELDDL